MIKDLNKAATKLANYMSDLSEEAYCAGWMHDLEYALWQAVEKGPRRYGQMTIDEEHIANLKVLSSRCGGWIIFDDETEETFVPMQEWVQKYQERGQQSVSG